MDLEALMNAHSAPESPEASVRANTRAEDSGENPYLHNPAEGMKLCAELIKRSSESDAYHGLLRQISQLIDQDFLALASADKNDTSTRTYARLQLFKQRLVELVNFPMLEQCYTVAVGGGFSAGKSRFLNSVLGCPSLLPTDTTPTTSIPTFICQGTEDRIVALNSVHKQTEIDEQALAAICHAFNDRYGVTFSHLLQLIAVERKAFRYPSLTFLDTPGYSKTDNITERSQNTDETIAREQLSRADYLIWLVDIQNGTIPKPDIEFIASLEIEQPVLVVFSKADKKPESHVLTVLEAARHDLQRAEVKFHDVIGYSSQTREEISETGDVLANMLNTINDGQRGSTILWQLNQILGQHISDYQTHQQSLKLTLGSLNRLLFDDSFTGEDKEHCEALQQKTRQQLDSLTNDEGRARALQTQLQGKVTELSEVLGLKVSQHPTRIAISGKYAATDGQESRTLTFNALCEGKLELLANRANLSQLTGHVDRISSAGVFIASDEHELEIVILKQQLKNTLGDLLTTEVIHKGMPVEIQVVTKSKCLVHIQIGQ